MTDVVLEWLAVYGLPVYFATLVISSAGIPFPITLMLIIVGAVVDDGQLVLWHVIALGGAGAVVGDNIGYAIGRFGGRGWVDKLSGRFNAADKVRRAEEFAHKWGGTGIFLSRWLITPLGPWINITSGLANYPWLKFLFWDVLGELLWVAIFVTIGMLFSEHVQEIAGLAGDLIWVIVGIATAAILGWLLLKHNRQDALHTSEAEG